MLTLTLKCTREYVEREVIECKCVGTKEQMADILTKRLQTPMVTKFVEKVLSNWCECSSDFSQHALMGEHAEFNVVMILERSYECSDCRILTHHQSDDVVAARCGSQEVSLQGASGVQCMNWHYRRSGNRHWT